MDSLTQIVLGAACGEIALGKKIGNKALLFGALGGTIPDLDVFVGRWFYTNEIDLLAFHRGFMHSIVFALIGALVVGFIVSEIYDSGKRKGTTDLRDWVWLFLLSIGTHPILDCFTPYGTQLFLPFTDYRVALNNISVVDPLYTLPLLICLIVVLFFKRSNPKRFKWAKAGIYISSAYMLFTLGNKLYVDSVFKKSFEEASINHERFSSQPTLSNNFLWYAVAESEANFHLAYYSIFDDENPSKNIITIPKNHDLISINDLNILVLRWFSKEYFTLSKNEDGQLIYSDLRYPLLDENDPSSSLFRFQLMVKEGRWDIEPFERNINLNTIGTFVRGIHQRAFRDF